MVDVVCLFNVEACCDNQSETSTDFAVCLTISSFLCDYNFNRFLKDVLAWY